MRTIARLVLVVLVVLGVSGCTRDVAFRTEPRGDAEGTTGLVLAIGEGVPIYVYDHHTGFETQGFACSDDADETGVTVADEAIVTVRRETWTKELNVNGFDVDALVFTLHGVRAGETTMTLRCSGHEAQTRVGVRAPE